MPAVIGFACESFQTNAAFAVGRRLKRRHPQLKLVLGGAGVRDGNTTSFQLAPWIDVVAPSGTEELLVPLYKALVAG
ncbi:hypothetical protein [Nannocystis pusilla]|uniref:hypothetical protein n=1 Tax=Nannocystis pusilla TaxID=889268 RepID=UPI003B818EBC